MMCDKITINKSDAATSAPLLLRNIETSQKCVKEVNCSAVSPVLMVQISTLKKTKTDILKFKIKHLPHEYWSKPKPLHQSDLYIKGVCWRHEGFGPSLQRLI